ncbi:DUF4180 domain-containing protein [Actinokineospora iranica]|uniref:DUF4180 domain-containing protein n=1 Tax=Actinokineospora iranica TaxID=1271860 RepID=A0A1G6JE01_9PSEU|nr:DUF4180 domain-containing protein [Actinokineospora iranica]SDC16873.1 protein of unknown function [Actinokineospora iranica]
MTDTITRLRDTDVLVCAADGPKVASDRDAVDLIGDAYGRGAAMVVLPVERLDERFFQLGTRVAGEVVNKFVGYQMPLAVLGDISAHLAASSAFRAFVHEANRGRHFWFVDDLADLTPRLG